MRSNRLLWECFRYFTRRIRAVEPFGQDGRALAQLISETVARRLTFILITVDDALSAYTVFETLNARGLELTTTDLLKNYLLARASSADRPSLLRRWQRIATTVAEERVPDLLRYHMLCEEPKVRRRRLFKQAAHHRASRAVKEGSVRGPRELFEVLRPIYVADERTFTDFSLLSIPTRGPSKRLVKHILARLEEDASSRRCDPETDPGTIEHILPENAGAEWEEEFPPGIQDSLVNRIGNLTLLEAGLNREVGNAPYPHKVGAYARSRYALAEAVAEMAPEDWTPARLEARQRQLAARAVHLWRSDFA